MKNIYFLVLLFCGFSICTQAQVSGFTGSFAPSNWQFVSHTPSGDASINTSGAPSSVVLTGSDTGIPPDNIDGYDDWQITISQSGTISFSYNFVNNDSSLLDTAQYVIAGTSTVITNQGAGSKSNISVTAGQIFAFRVFNGDNDFGRGVLTVSNFTFTPPNVLAVTSTQVNVSCNGGNNGSATVSASGGTSPYTYSWAPSGGTAATATGLSVGTYTCTVKDAVNNSVAKSVTITQPSALSANTSQTDVSCNGGNNGSATVTPSGGTSPYTYAWTPSGGTGATASNLAIGSYTCTIKDVNNCTLAKNFTINQPSVLTATTSQINVLCSGGNTGSATVVPSGGTSPYTYSWSPSGGAAAVASNLVAGNYTCTIKDSKNCTITRNFTIIQPAAFAATTSQVNVLCNGGNTGSATVVPSGGTSPYTYAWFPSGGTGSTASNLTVGNYTCTIKDFNNCTITRNFNVTQPSVLVATTSQVNVLCNGGNTGSATVVPSGGTSPYTYSWSPSGGTGATASSLAIGNYICTIKDANNCTITKNFTITQPGVLTATTSQENVLCNGGNTGSATVVPSGGTSPYTYSWSPSGGIGATASNLIAGNYTCTIKDANNCTITRNFTVTQPAVLDASTSQVNVACSEGSTGSATVTPSGGTSPYTYLWAPTGGAGATASGLAQGNYSCTITDAKGCAVVKNFTITNSAGLVATTSQTNVLCNGGDTGSATVTPSGGSSPYNYLWTPSGGTNAMATRLKAGVYACTVTDSKGCELIQNITITQPLILESTISKTDVLCNGGNTGSATVVPNGGTLPYTYLWLPNGGTGAIASNLTAGNYVCTITDANNCSINKTISVIQPVALTVATSQVNVACNGGKSGSVTITPGGGNPPYQVSFNGGAYNNVGASVKFENLGAGSYDWSAKDLNGCVVNGVVSITQPVALQVTSSHVDAKCNGGTEGSVSITFSGGKAPYQVSFNGGGFLVAVSPVLYSNLSAGVYDWIVKDANSCAVDGSEIVGQSIAIQASVTHEDVKCNGGNDGSVTISFNGGAVPYSIMFNEGSYENVVSPVTFGNLASGIYSWTLKDANGCMVSGSQTINQPLAPIISQNITTPMGDSEQNALCLTDTSKILKLGDGFVGTIQWQTVVQESTPDVNTIWTDIINAEGTQYMVSNPLSGKNWFRVVLSPSNCEPAFSNAEFIYYKACLGLADVDQTTFGVTVFPSPYKDNFTIKLVSLSGENIDVTLFDMAGRIIEKKNVSPNNLSNQKFGEGLPIGVYNLIVNQGSHSKVLRLIKQ